MMARGLSVPRPDWRLSKTSPKLPRSSLEDELYKILLPENGKKISKRRRALLTVAESPLAFFSCDGTCPFSG